MQVWLNPPIGNDTRQKGLLPFSVEVCLKTSKQQFDAAEVQKRQGVWDRVYGEPLSAEI